MVCHLLKTTSVDYDSKSPTTIKFFKKVQNKMHYAVTIPMTMDDWSKRIDKYLLSDDLDVLKDAGKISHEIACDKALSEFEKYRVIQDKIFESDFDKFILDGASDNK